MSRFAHHAAARTAEAGLELVPPREVAAPARCARPDTDARHRFLALCAGVAVAALAAAAAPAAGAAADAARYGAALDEYEIGHYEVAFNEFAALADRGHCQAARIARQMVREGRGLYPIVLTAPPERLESWRRLPGCNAGAPQP